VLLAGALVVVVLAAGIAIAAASGGRPAAKTASLRVVGLPAPGLLANAPHAPPAPAASAARTFLGGYLAYVYGHAPAADIRDATPPLIAAFGRVGPSLTPAGRRLHPVVVGLGAHEATGSVLHVTALISDGIARYTLQIVLSHEQSGWVTTQLPNAE
jgi:hypothetical protein